MDVISPGMEPATLLVLGYYIRGDDLPATDEVCVKSFTAFKKLIK